MKNNFKKWCQTSAVLAILQVSAENLPEKKEKMKYSNIILGGLVAFAGTAVAMPTQEETEKVEPLVLDLMKDDQVALKNGKKSRVEVAESAMALADKADSEAAKLLLMKGAFNLYVRAGEFDKAIETLQALQAAIPDIPPANMANIIEASLRVVSRKNGGQHYRLLDETKTRMRYTNAAKKMEKALMESPNDRQLRTKLAEHYAYLGKWDNALENFIAADGKAGAIAKAEQGGEAGEKAADFWWNYPTGKADELVKSFRTHSAKLYEDALVSGKITGLNKVQAERRIKETKEYGEQNLFTALEPLPKDGLYCVVDLSKGPNSKKYPVTYLKDMPKSGWTDEYKREKLVLRKILPGSFDCVPGKTITITKPFYIGVFEMTQRQYELVNGYNPSEFQSDLHPVEHVSCKDIRGAQLGSKWPESDKVDTDSFMGKIRQRTGLLFDLPTEAQWELACLGNATDAISATPADILSHGKFRENAGQNAQHSKVGSFRPNSFGLYDMFGNVWELCLDRRDGRQRSYSFGKEMIDSTTDPKGNRDGNMRAQRGASFLDSCRLSNPDTGWIWMFDGRNGNNGFRLCLNCKPTPERDLKK